MLTLSWDRKQMPAGNWRKLSASGHKVVPDSEHHLMIPVVTGSRSLRLLINASPLKRLSSAVQFRPWSTMSFSEKLPSLYSLLCDPLICAGLEEIERQGSSVQHLLVELADIEPGAQVFLRAFTEFADLELAQLVTEGLRGPRDVAVGLRLDCRLVHRTGLAEEIHYLAASPSFRVNSSIDDQTYRAEEFR